ncbi:hypothetical protein NDU88_009999 [Pleurodeles waltl]|uniref:Uncharacterized protein n=1 Tax=Pleurodeles waltl TaxID=8319 RepID=A0AAV7RY87_PLEWA|nr:hypothetical protein NDU88_009999 [Pleurodeles waltl]
MQPQHSTWTSGLAQLHSNDFRLRLGTTAAHQKFCGPPAGLTVPVGRSPTCGTRGIGSEDNAASSLALADAGNPREQCSESTMRLTRSALAWQQARTLCSTSPQSLRPVRVTLHTPGHVNSDVQQPILSVRWTR